jgi:hypothetical protein
MYRVLMALLSCLILATLTLFGTALQQAPSRHVRVPSDSTPSTAPSYPVCATEEGAGQALCTWDGSAQGNGQGESILSGDCAYNEERTRTLCINLYARDSREAINSDGSINSIPNGADLVRECQMELQDRNNWTESQMRNCFNAQLLS